MNTSLFIYHIFYEKDRRVYADRADYLKHAVSRRRKVIRQTALKYKGDQCSICNYNKCFQALEFHHMESSKKDFGISASGYTRSWKAIKEELDKCILLCANCHREVHEGITQLPQVIVVEKQGEFGEALSL
ncbi:MAG: hypothetical protein NTY12_01250 [Candidatus Falkowbacteria bacterium]|nr:hypothetical protein [Candidatus Falkowbacteria bacterium]